MKQHTEWRSVPGFEGYYEVSSIGGARRADNRRQLKPWKAANGYLRYAFYVDGIRHSVQANRIVCLAWHGAPTDGMEACHNNGIKDDNRPDNLRWGTSSENKQDTVRHGRNRNSRKTHCPKGHEYSPENTRYVRETNRICRTCENVRRKSSSIYAA
jgi:hypothetical protein